MCSSFSLFLPLPPLTRDPSSWVWQEIKNALTRITGRPGSERATDLSVSVCWRVSACGLHVEKYRLVSLVVQSGCCANHARHWVDAEVTVWISRVYVVPHGARGPCNMAHLFMNGQLEFWPRYKLNYLKYVLDFKIYFNRNVCVMM
jgi:hypothetical protein